jgi:hypothetical protein
MRILHILKTAPDHNTRVLVDILSADETTIFNLFEERPDYEKLIDLIFENDKIISWW